MKKYKKAQSILEYSLLIAAVVGVSLVMGLYLKRSAQGRIQAYGDQVGDQYVVSDTKNTEVYETQVSTTEITAPGIGHPTTITTSSGSYHSEKDRQLRIW